MFGSSLGRFTSPDDFLNDTDTADPQSWNLYVYVRNNPLRFIDPSGERIWIYYQETVTRTNEDGEDVTESVTRRAEYTFDGLKNEDGSEYTGSNSYVLAARDNINFLLQDPTLGKAISDLVKTKKDFKIMQDPNDPNRNTADRNQKAGEGATIYWSGKGTKVWANMTEANPSFLVPAFSGLAHELIGHAWIVFKGLERTGDERVTTPGLPGFGIIPNAEIDAVNIENRAMMIEDPSCGSCRFTYGGRDMTELSDPDFLSNRGKRRKPPTLKRSPR